MSRTLPLLNRAIGGLTGLIGMALLFGGVWLLRLGGSLYYVLAGAAYLFAGVQLWRLQARGAWWVAGVAFVTLPWALWECGTKYWALFPRLLMPLVLAALALLSAAPLLAKEKRLAMRGAGTFALVFVVAQFALAFTTHGAIQTAPGTSFKVAKVHNIPSDWSAYGRTTAGTRYAPFDQINRANVAELKVAWQFHTWRRPGHAASGRRYAPLAFSTNCSMRETATSLVADSEIRGSVRWPRPRQARCNVLRCAE